MLTIERRRGLVAALTLLTLATAVAQERTHDITVDDYLSVYGLTDVATAPDGRHVAFVEMRWGEHDEPRQLELWVVDTQDRTPTRLTFSPVDERSPRWAPDGTQLYFLTKRSRGDKYPPYDGSTQVWTLGLQPGEPQPVTRVKGGVDAFELADDGRTLYYTTDGEKAKRPWGELRGKYPDIEFGEAEFHFTELWKLDLQSWRSERVAAPERVIGDFAISPDQHHAAFITMPDARPLSREGKSRVDILDIQTGQTITLADRLYRAEAPSPHGWLENLAWSADSAAVAFTIDFDGYPSELFVGECRDAGWEVWKLTRPGEVHHAGGLHWTPTGRDLCFLAEDHARKRVYSLTEVRDGHQGALRVLTPGDVGVQAYSLAHDGRGLAAIWGTTTNFGDVFWGDAEAPDAEWVPLSNANPQTATWKLPQVSIVQWKAPDGTPVEGVLELPPAYKAGDAPLPLVVELHGGPTSATLMGLRYWIYGRTLFAARGYALLSPNYRGSTGYGDKFLTDLIGHENDVEVKDILSGVDALIERGIADPERMGVMGWSNGGFLVNAVITTTTRFKAASSGAGVVDQFMQWASEDTPNHVINYMRGLPWQRAEAYLAASPAYKLGQVTTPTIIHVGAQDERVPAVHARALYRALKDHTETPTVLLVYPKAGHGLMVSDHRKGKLEWDVAWFDKYVRGQTPEGEEK